MILLERQSDSFDAVFLVKARPEESGRSHLCDMEGRVLLNTDSKHFIDDSISIEFAVPLSVHMITEQSIRQRK